VQNRAVHRRKRLALNGQACVICYADNSAHRNFKLYMMGGLNPIPLHGAGAETLVVLPGR
jgi:hypothetical protein